jgi:hypothetical protein
MLSVLLAVLAGVMFGRLLGTIEPQKPAAQKVRVDDLRRRVIRRR